VANKQDYLAQVQVAVSHLHRCGAVGIETVPVHEVFRGKTVWRGDVEVFALTVTQKPNALMRGAIWTVPRMSARASLPCWKLEKFLEDAFTYRTVSSERKQAFYNDTQMAGFLFEQDIVDFLKKLRDMGDELTVAHEKSRLEEPGSNERMALGKVRERVLTELFDIHRDLRETFSPYLKLSKWHWGFIWKFSN
jgi:hypothetical protein